MTEIIEPTQDKDIADVEKYLDPKVFISKHVEIMFSKLLAILCGYIIGHWNIDPKIVHDWQIQTEYFGGAIITLAVSYGLSWLRAKKDARIKAKLAQKVVEVKFNEVVAASK